jgi:hypothetical protein
MVAMELAYGDPPFLTRLGLDDEALDATAPDLLHFLTSIRRHQLVLRYADLKEFQAWERGKYDVSGQTGEVLLAGVARSFWRYVPTPLVRNEREESVPHRLWFEFVAGVDGTGVWNVKLVGMANDVKGVRDLADQEGFDLAHSRVIELAPLVLKRPAEGRPRRD